MTKPKASTPLQTIFDERFAPQKLLGKAEQTKKLYRHAVKLFAEFLGRRPALKDLNDATACAFLVWYSTQPRPGTIGDTVTVRTVNNLRDHLLGFWRWCARKRLVDEWPDVTKLPEPEQTPDAWTMDEIRRLIAACADEAQIGLISGQLFWEALHYWLWDTGERTGATLALPWTAVDLETGRVVVPGAIRKAGKTAIYQLLPHTLERFRTMRALDPAAEMVFQWGMTIHIFYRRYGRLLKRAGLPSGRRHKPQKMRRSFASHLEAAGHNATDALLHSSRSVTQRSYLDPKLTHKNFPKPPALHVATAVSIPIHDERPADAEDLLRRLLDMLKGGPA